MHLFSFVAHKKKLAHRFQNQGRTSNTKLSKHEYVHLNCYLVTRHTSVTNVVKVMYEGVVRRYKGASYNHGFTLAISIEPALVSQASDVNYNIHDEASWCIRFVYDIVLIDKTNKTVNQKLELWKSTLESKNLG